MKRVIGVTGNLCSGKSLVCSYLEELGGKWIDADKIAHEIIEEKKEKIKEIFGEYLKRKEIAKVIFSNEKIKRKYEKWIHKEIGKKIKEIIENSNDKFYFIEGALIFEANANREMDFVIYVRANNDILIKRATERGMDEEMVKKILYFQNKLKNKEERADFLIENNGDKKELKEKTENIFKIIKNSKPRFIGDLTCLREVKWLRLLGFDAEKAKFLKEIIKGIYEEKRYLLTRKKGYSFPKWKIFKVPEAPFKLRLKRIIDFFEIKGKIEPFTRCSECNSEIKKIEKEKIKNKVPYYTYKTHENFYICENCSKIYWKGSHFHFFEKHLKEIMK